MVYDEIRNEGGQDGVTVLAVGSTGLEPVADLAETEQELLLVSANRLDEETAEALSACRERLRRAGRSPFFMRTVHKGQTDSAARDGLFDLTLVCGRRGDLPLSLPAELTAALFGATEKTMFINLDREDILSVLCRPGTLTYFQKSACWQGDPTEAMEQLSRELAEEANACRAGCAQPLRMLIDVGLSLDLSLEALECLNAMTEPDNTRDNVLFQANFLESAPESSVTVRGLIGAW